MSSVEICTIRGRVALAYREWDGIDKPSYLLIMYLREDEYIYIPEKLQYKKTGLGRLAKFGGDVTQDVKYTAMLGDLDPTSDLASFLFYETQGTWYLSGDPLFYTLGFELKADLMQLVLKFKGQIPYFLEPMRC